MKVTNKDYDEAVMEFYNLLDSTEGPKKEVFYLVSELWENNEDLFYNAFGLENPSE